MLTKKGADPNMRAAWGNQPTPLMAAAGIGNLQVVDKLLELGADLVLHSATKYLGGHNDLLAGAICGNAGLVSALRDFRGVLGGVLDPHSAYLLIRGLKTLPLRGHDASASVALAGPYNHYSNSRRIPPW